MKIPSLNMCIKYIKAFKGFPIYAHPFYPTDITEEERIEMIDAFKKGFEEATKTWGDKLPDISQSTYDAVLEKMDAWKNQVESGTETI